MNKLQLDEATLRVYKNLLERFGEPIGRAPATPGVPDERQDEGAIMCQGCGIDIDFCECEMNEAKKRKGPTKSTAKKILKGTKTFKDKMQKVSGWADNQGAAAAWMMKKATGKYPGKK